MMQININEIKSTLKAVLLGEASREDAADWALKLRIAGDANQLEYIPGNKEQLIWESILFIEGIDLQDEPNSYLHNETDLWIFLERL